MVVADVDAERFVRAALRAPPGVVIVLVFSASDDPCRVRLVDNERRLCALGGGLSEEGGFVPAMFVGVL